VIVTGDRVAEFVTQKIGIGAFYGPHQAIGLERDGRIVAGGVFYFYSGNDFHLAIASERGCLSRDILKAWGKYCVETSGCARVTVVTEQPLVISMAVRLGGQIEGVLRNFFGPGRNGTLIGILKEHWRFSHG